jgi:hypothetical protein
MMLFNDKQAEGFIKRDPESSATLFSNANNTFLPEQQEIHQNSRKRHLANDNSLPSDYQMQQILARQLGGCVAMPIW